MDSITLENFISFCDDMQIANEGFNVKATLKKVWDSICRFFREIGRRIKDAFNVLRGKQTSKEKELAEKLLKNEENMKKTIDKLSAENISTLEDCKKHIHANKMLTEQIANLSKSITAMSCETASNENKINDLQKNITVLEENINELENLRKENSDYIRKISDLKDKIERLEEYEKSMIEFDYKRAKKALLTNKESVVTDQWGYVEMCLKAFPAAEKIIPDCIKVIDDASRNNITDNTVKILDKIEKDVDDQYSTCKSIFRHSEQESARQNPKTYSYNTLNKYFEGLKNIYSKLSGKESNLRKIYESQITNNPYAAGPVHVSSDIDNSAIINRIFIVNNRLLSVLYSYVSLIYKVKGLNDRVKPSNYISYNNYKGYYNYGKNKHENYYQ